MPDRIPRPLDASFTPTLKSIPINWSAGNRLRRLRAAVLSLALLTVGAIQVCGQPRRQ